MINKLNVMLQYKWKTLQRVILEDYNEAQKKENRFIKKVGDEYAKSKRDLRKRMERS